MMSEEKCPERDEDIEELRAVFSAITDFIKELFPQIKELINSVAGSLEGGKLGKEAGEFYKGLVEAGMDPQRATQLTEEFVRKKLDILDIASKIQSFIPKREVVEEKVVKGPQRREGDNA